MNIINVTVRRRIKTFRKKTFRVSNFDKMFKNISRLSSTIFEMIPGSASEIKKWLTVKF